MNTPATPPSDEEWLDAQIRTYLDHERPACAAFAQLLEAVLHRVRKDVAPLAFVGVRVKEPDSFAEKALRKRDAYPDPVHDLNDLCGGRIVVPTLDDIEPVERRVRELLAVDEEDIEDKRLLHDDDSFGYLSIHFLVGIDPARLPPDLPPESAAWVDRVHSPDRNGRPRQRKAELQIRTLLQHAWSDISHDRLYKTRVRVPATYRREAASLAALLESADIRFAEVAARIDAYQDRFAAYLEPDQIRTEIRRLHCIRSNPNIADRKKHVLARRIALLARSLGDWDMVLETCGTEAGQEPETALLAGEALCLRNRATPASPDFARGTDLLRKVSDTPGVSDGLRADALARLAWALSLDGSTHLSHLRDLRYRAWIAAPENPYHFKEFLETAVIAAGNLDPADLLRVQARSCLDTCLDHAAAGIELPAARFAAAQLLLFLGEHEAALETYAEALTIPSPTTTVEDEWRSVERLSKTLPELPSAFENTRVLLALGVLVRRLQGAPETNTRAALESLGLRFDPTPLQTPVWIAVGHGADPVAFDGETEILETALRHWPGTVLCGGTRSGLSGVLGRIIAESRSATAQTPSLIGYLPEHPPGGIEAESSCDRLVLTPGSRNFSVAEPLRMWIDLIAAGVPPTSVRVLGIGGGPIAAFEYRLGLALGATVALIEGSGGAADAFLGKNGAHPRVLAVPPDPGSLWSLLRAPDPGADLSAHEGIGRAIHESYRAGKREELLADSAVPGWEEIGEPFRQSNRHQAAFARTVLETAGFQLVSTDDPRPVAEFSPEEVEQMAENEHGRWCAERLLQGWRKGERDNQARLHPNLVPWKDLPESIKELDRNAIRSWPTIFAIAGHRIVHKEHRIKP